VPQRSGLDALFLLRQSRRISRNWRSCFNAACDQTVGVLNKQKAVTTRRPSRPETGTAALMSLHDSEAIAVCGRRDGRSSLSFRRVTGCADLKPAPLVRYRGSDHLSIHSPSTPEQPQGARCPSSKRRDARRAVVRLALARPLRFCQRHHGRPASNDDLSWLFACRESLSCVPTTRATHRKAYRSMTRGEPGARRSLFSGRSEGQPRRGSSFVVSPFSLPRKQPSISRRRFRVEAGILSDDAILDLTVTVNDHHDHVMMTAATVRAGETLQLRSTVTVTSNGATPHSTI
jgi:hypothetical protein